MSLCHYIELDFTLNPNEFCFEFWKYKMYFLYLLANINTTFQIIRKWQWFSSKMHISSYRKIPEVKYHLVLFKHYPGFISVINQYRVSLQNMPVTVLTVLLPNYRQFPICSLSEITRTVCVCIVYESIHSLGGKNHFSSSYHIQLTELTVKMTSFCVCYFTAGQA